MNVWILSASRAVRMNALSGCAGSSMLTAGE